MKKILSIILISILCFGLLTACGEEQTIDPASLGGTVHIEITVRNFGSIKAELYPKVAPITVAHIVTLIQENFYDGLIFHRVIDGFMIQGGDPTGTGMGASGQEMIKGEFSDNGVRNELKNIRGTLAMARRDGNYNSATSQFFINTEDNSHLDGQYATFGMVTEGMDVVDAIAAVPTDSKDKPLTDVVIESIRVLEGAENVSLTTTVTTVETPEEETPTDPYADPVYIVIEVAGFGTIKADLYPSAAPITVAHIKALIEDGFYDGLKIHRVDPGFVIQGGDPAGNGFGVDGQETIKGEFSANGVNNPLKNTRGTLAMARVGNDYDSATSQFYINLADNDFLDGNYATFGMVTEGMDVVDAIAAVETDAYERPLTDVVITSIRIAE